MINNKQIKIRPVGGKCKIQLCLSGTILICHEKAWSSETLLDIPIELISITKEKKIYGDRLIFALFSFIFVPGIFYLIYCLFKFYINDLPYSVTSFFITAGLISSVVAFLIQFVYLFIKKESVTLTINSSELTISFWVQKKNKKDVYELIDEIQKRKKIVKKTIPYPMQLALADNFETPWKRVIVLTYFISLPGIIIKNYWLFIPAAIPLIYLLYINVINLRCPKMFRKAHKLFRQKRWNDAINCVNEVVKEYPKYLQAKLFLIELMMRTNNYSKADNVLSKIEYELDTETLQEIQQEIILRKRVFERQN